jgi:hypothetical protein
MPIWVSPFHHRRRQVPCDIPRHNRRSDESQHRLHLGYDHQTDGSMRGSDSKMNPWTYDAGSKTYMNLGTGKMCRGEGLARTCFES